MFNQLVRLNGVGTPVQKFRVTLSDADAVVSDHRVCGTPVLPGVGYLELVSAAVRQLVEMDGSASLRFTRVLWLRPFAPSRGPTTLDLEVTVVRDRFMKYAFFADDAQLLARGRVSIGKSSPVMIALTELGQRCGQRTIHTEEFYSCLSSSGLDYGPAFRGVANVRLGPNCLIAELRCPAQAAGRNHEFTIHPAMADAALQTVAVLQEVRSGAPVRIPFAADAVEIYGQCTDDMWVSARSAPLNASCLGGTAALDIADQRGRVAIQIRGLLCRSLAGGRPGFGARR